MRSVDGWDDCDPPDEILVLDTTTIVVDGLPLKQLSIAQVWPGISQWTSNITERLGWEWFFTLFPACIAIEGPTGMRCYSDNQISWSNFQFGCTSLVGLVETSRNTPTLFPNPGTDHFTIQLPANMCESRITLFDAQGRLLLRRDLSQGATSINCRDLAPGLFTYRIEDDRGSTIAAGRWVKE